MGRRWATLGMLAASLLPGCGTSPRVAASVGAATSLATSLECVPFARRVSGIQLYGAAYSWWDQAAGRYARSAQPAPGGVLVFRRGGSLDSGHVSVVDRVISAREITVTQANWVHRRITRNELVLDVSAANDWSAVRVWWAPTGALGNTIYPTYGFIAPDASGRGLAAGL